MASAAGRLHLPLHANGRRQPAEQQAATPKQLPGAMQHRLEMLVVSGEVQNGAAQNNISGVLREGRPLDRLGAEVVQRKMRRDFRRETLDYLNRDRIRIDPEDLVASAHQVNKITARPASHVDDAHARNESAAKKLVEQIDVDLAKLVAKIG